MVRSAVFQAAGVGSVPTSPTMAHSSKGRIDGSQPFDTGSVPVCATKLRGDIEMY